MSIDLGQSGHGDLHNPFQESYIMPASQDESELHETRMGLRTIDELQVAAKEQERQDIINRRDARRKSLGKWHSDPMKITKDGYLYCFL